MISLYDLNGARLPITFNGFVANAPGDPQDNTFEINTVSLLPQFHAATETDPTDDGAESGPIFKGLTVLRMDGVLRQQSYDAMMDKVLAIAVAYDPGLGRLLSPATNGIYPLDFTTLTTDTTNYTSPAGQIPARYYGRARRTPLPAFSEYTALAAYLTIELELFDPRRYLQTLTTLSCPTGTTNANNTLANYPSWPTMTITMTGAGSATFQVSRSAVGLYPGVVFFALDLSGALNGDVFTVDMKLKTVDRLRAGVHTDQIALKVGGAWGQIVPGTNPIVVANGTNAAPVLTWRRAWVT